MANFLVVAIHALDGSREVARLNALSAAVSGPLGQAREMREQADLIPHRIAASRRRAHRAAVDAITRAGHPLTAADQAISAARAAHQGTGPHASLPSDPNQHEHVAGYRDPNRSPGPTCGRCAPRSRTSTPTCRRARAQSGGKGPSPAGT